ncbi:trypsin-like peptidase domain-containing protein [Pseudoruegeria sp. HB172150]|uniref:trypsin-like peptidase domain-containing protein n=1 Tax=Pseudoruegeria sp. HB172150 TaxID=2721164 RepID=UPI00155349EC|nr:trypsin-like peptidase domain-containing protein [Pseudoruegeria sp. HB172150]
MKQVATALFTVAALLWAGIAAAQSTFIQVEARPDLNAAQESVRAIAGIVRQVKGFRMASGWYGVAIGPFTEEEAIDRMQRLKLDGLIPADAFLTDASAYTQQFYPVGGSALAGTAPEAPSLQGETATASNQPGIPVISEPTVTDTETPQQAARSEAILPREDKLQLQRALQWFGFYNGAIDAAFGPGTRASMAAWQEDQGLDPTGILTTVQRGMLLDEYRSVLSSLGLTQRIDDVAGIQMTMPLAMVEFDRYEPPFAHYEAINNSGVSVLLISQTGDEATLLGLYDIMQTLEIVPLNGNRNRSANSFTLTGENDRIRSYTYAVLSGGAVKGFTLIWPAGEDRRYNVALQAMRDSFAPISGAVLPDAFGDAALDQSVDLFAGLEIRAPESTRSGFYVDGSGTVLTTTEAVDGCGRITLEEVYDAAVTARDDTLGLALLRPSQTLAPLGYARFQGHSPRLQTEVAVSGYSYEGVLSSPTLTYGTLAAARGLQGEETMKRLALNATPSDAGGPVFDTTGAVLGMLLPEENPDGKRLPEGVSFATDGLAIAEFLSNSGVTASASDNSGALSSEDLAQLASTMTVLVSCWD